MCADLCRATKTQPIPMAHPREVQVVLSLDWWYLETEPALFLSVGSFVLRLWLRLFGELQFWGGEEPQTGEEVAVGGVVDTL